MTLEQQQELYYGKPSEKDKMKPSWVKNWEFINQDYIRKNTVEIDSSLQMF